MKTNNFKLAIAALTVVSFFVTMPTMQSLANNTNPVEATTTAQPTINIKVLAQQDEFMILEIDLNQPIEQSFTLLINDEKATVCTKKM